LNPENFFVLWVGPFESSTILSNWSIWYCTGTHH